MFSASEFEALVRNARLLLEAGASIDDLLSYARAKDDSKITGIRLLQELKLKTLGEAKEAVDGSAAWADRKEADAAFQEDLRKIWREMDEEESSSG